MSEQTHNGESSTAIQRLLADVYRVRIVDVLPEDVAHFLTEVGRHGLVLIDRSALSPYAPPRSKPEVVEVWGTNGGPLPGAQEATDV